MINTRFAQTVLSLITVLILAGCASLQAPNSEEGKNAQTASTGASISIPGTITEINGTAMYGNSKSYVSELYYGRLSHGAKLELVSKEVGKNEFGLLVVKVKVISDSDYGANLVGKTGWVTLTETDLADYYDQESKSMKATSEN